MYMIEEQPAGNGEERKERSPENVRVRILLRPHAIPSAADVPIVEAELTEDLWEVFSP